MTSTWLVCSHCQARFEVEPGPASATMSCRACGHPLAPSAATLPSSPAPPTTDEPQTADQPGTSPGAAPPTVAQVVPSVPIRAAPAALPAIPGHDMLGVLGRGGMGVVYKARQKSLKRLVALKMMLDSAHAGPTELARFRSEAEAVARLQHPNIVQIHEVGEHEGRAFFSLEFVEGGTLARKIGGQPQPAREAAALVATLARAMHHAHQRGIVHRDLKPANVLLTSDGTPKITDFGLAKQLENDDGQTRTGAVMGTPSYMAPEQAAGKVKEIGPLTDVYALGVILYEMLSGRTPFAGGSVLEILEQVRSVEPPLPSRFQQRVHPDLETVCLKAMAKEPSRRYESALALAEDLDRFNAGEPILARREGMAARLWRKASRNRVTVSLTVVVVLAVAASAYLGVVAVRTAREHRFETIGEEVRQGLTSTDISAEHLTGMEEKIAALQGVDPARADDARRQLYEQLVVSIRGVIQQPRLTREDTVRVERAIALLPGHKDDLVEPLRRELHNRQRAWEPVFELAAPFAAVPTIFDSTRVKAVQDALIAQAPARLETAPNVFEAADYTVLTRAPCEGNVQLEAVFAEGWDAVRELGLILHATRPHTLPVCAVAFSRDGRKMASASGWWNRAGEVKVWDVLTRRQQAVFALRKEGYPSLAFSPDGKTLAVIHGSQEVSLVDAMTGRERLCLRGHNGGVGALAFSPDGRTLATGTGRSEEYGEVKLWDPESGANRATWHCHTDVITALAFSPDGKLLATGSRDQDISLWDVATQGQHAVLTGHTGAVLCVQFDPTAPLLVSSSEDYSLRVWDTATAAEKMRLSDGNRISRLDFAPDGKLLALADDTVRLWDSGLRNGRPALQGQRCLAAAWAPDGKTIATGTQDRSIHWWDVETGKKTWSAQESSYCFLLRPAERKAATTARVRPTLKDVRGTGGDFTLTILRNDASVKEQSFKSAQLPLGPLRMIATREGDRLTLQVGALEPVRCQELFPLAGSSAAVFGLYWPTAARIQTLRGWHQAMPAAPSLLERGDDLYARDQFAEALACFQDQALQAGAGQEARLKEALCLLALRRAPEAAEQLGRLVAERGERWPLVAACQLWLLHLQNGRFADADSVFETIGHRFSFTDLAAQVPQELRDQITEAYTAEFLGSNLFRARPDLGKKLERAEAVYAFFQATPWQRFNLNIACLRAYHLAGDTDRALKVAEALLREEQSTSRVASNWERYGLFEHYCWLLRERGAAQQALARLDDRLFEKPGVMRPTSQTLLVERARVLAALGRWDEAEQSAEDYCRLVPRNQSPYLAYSGACLIRGFLRLRRGDEAGAQAAWRDGLYAQWKPEKGRAPLSWAEGTTIYNAMILVGLTGELTDADAEDLVAGLLQRVGGDAAAALVSKGFLRVSPTVFREMCRAPRGRAAARKIAFLDLGFAEYLRTPPQLIAAEMMHQGACPGALNVDQEAILWQSVEALYRALTQGKLDNALALQLALGWKGTTNFLGWKGAAASMPPTLRGPLAYMFGLRYERVLKKPDDVLLFFRTARDDAPADSLLRRLAQAELDRLRKK